MSPGLKSKHVAIVASISLLLAFQNCSQAPEDSGSSSSLESLTPFAYEAKIDTLSHMSCSGLSDTGPERRAYYSFRAGAYSPATGGLTMTQKFRDETRLFNNDQRARIFAISDKNSNTNLSMSIRSVANYQQVWKEGETRAGEELDSFLPSLDSQAVAGPLAATQTNQMVNYFPGPQTQRLMEASLRYYHFENTMKDTRSALDRRDALLAIGYSGSSDSMDTALRIPDDDPRDSITPPTNRAYGTGHYLRFALPVGYTAGEYRVIAPNGGIEEVDLQTNTVKASAPWDCSTSYQFMVIRPEDKANGLVVCDATVDRYADANQQAALNAIRRVLRVEDWFVDVARRCIMPKRTGDYCYGPLNGRVIQYGQASCLNSNTTMCPHFVSVCIKH